MLANTNFLTGPEINRARFNEAYNFLPESKRADHLSTTSLLQFHLTSLLHRNDRMGMMAGIESRFPFLDNSIISFALNLPTKSKIHPVMRLHNNRHPFLLDKAVVRHACEGKIPSQILHKKKIGFPTHGHQSLVMKPVFFDEGYVEDAFELNRACKNQLMAPENSFFAARMASVEVFGRLFQHGQSQEEITEHLQRNAAIDSQLHTQRAIG